MNACMGVYAKRRHRPRQWWRHASNYNACACKKPFEITLFELNLKERELKKKERQQKSLLLFQICNIFGH